MKDIKFKLTTESMVNVFGIKLFRIEALISFKDVKKGDKGGWVETESINGNSRVSGNAWVSGDAQVFGNSRVSGNAWVSGDAQVFGNSRVYGDAWVYGNAQVSGDAWVSGNARVYGNAQVSGDAWVSGNARVYGDAWVYGNAQVSGDAWVIAKITKDMKDVRASLYAQTYCLPDPEGYVILFKCVNKTSKSTEWTSLHDASFKYIKGKIAEAKDPEESERSCASGLHVSFATYWDSGDTLIACKIHIDDIITVQEGKARVRKLLVLGKVKEIL